MSTNKQNEQSSTTAVRQPEVGINLDELDNILKTQETLAKAARGYFEIKERERRKEEKADTVKVEEFKGFVHPVYAAHVKTKPEMLNRIFDENHIDKPEKGFLMKEMAIAIKHTIPEYRDRSLHEMQYIISQWIYDANQLRIVTKEGSKIHCTELGGHYRFRWHINNFPDDKDYKKQQDTLTVRVQDANKTLENRNAEWEELKQKKAEPEPKPQEILVASNGQETQET